MQESELAELLEAIVNGAYHPSLPDLPTLHRLETATPVPTLATAAVTTALGEILSWVRSSLEPVPARS